MIRGKKITEIARTWRSKTAMTRKRISLANFKSWSNSSLVCASGHFVIYSIEHKRFVLPLEYLSNNIYKELLEMSAQLFELQSGPIILPCEADFLRYIVLLIQKGLAKETEEALVSSMQATCRAHSSAFSQEQTAQDLLVCSH